MLNYLVVSLFDFPNNLRVKFPNHKGFALGITYSLGVGDPTLRTTLELQNNYDQCRAKWKQNYKPAYFTMLPWLTLTHHSQRSY